MITLRCIERIEKNNKIVLYRLDDSKGTIMNATPEILKNNIINKEVEVINMKLTSNRILIPEPNIPLSPLYLTGKQIENMVLKAKVLGMCNEITTKYGNKLYLIKKTNRLQTLCIPDDVHVIDHCPINWGLPRVGIEVVGGNNLNVAEELFKGAIALWLDINRLNTHNVISMKRMFVGGYTRVIGLESLDTSNVTNMSEMFRSFSKLNIGKLQFNTSKVINMMGMFYGCKAKSLDLSAFDTSRVLDMDLMFANAKIDKINLTSFDTRRVSNMIQMFLKCHTPELDLTSFVIDPDAITNEMFEGCGAKIKSKDPLIYKILNKKE